MKIDQLVQKLLVEDNIYVICPYASGEGGAASTLANISLVLSFNSN
jgi:hypothetical protein